MHMLRRTSCREQASSMVAHKMCIHTLTQAYELQQAGKQYIVKDDKIVLVDENTGRLKAITRYQDGMHQ
eukprot:scaffold4900_cov23-Tisochrysis_lutea.AAC.1